MQRIGFHYNHHTDQAGGETSLVRDGFASAYFKGRQHMSKSQRSKKKDDKKKPAKTMKEKKLAKREKKAKKDNPGIPTA
ncbi:MAG: hypothetical protein KDE58_42085 [Caldilineaceae bacterium]|nr:hypothetical protein [Caldilineaceae bacterium]